LLFVCVQDLGHLFERNLGRMLPDDPHEQPIGVGDLGVYYYFRLLFQQYDSWERQFSVKEIQCRRAEQAGRNLLAWFGFQLDMHG
jgi:hypothetical protein